jgi:ubiquinone/menaquinone biosynthesis C-methylase UbiE
MSENAQADLKIQATRDERARQHFVSGMRSYILHGLADGLRTVYEKRVQPAFTREHGRDPQDGPEVHKALKPETIFKFYSSMRCNAQEMVWRSVMPTVQRNARDLAERAKALSSNQTNAQGTLELDPDFEVPKAVSAIDIHLMPGSYDSEYMPDDVSIGAVYDNGGAVFSAGLLGKAREDIGASISMFVSEKYPDFKPLKILDIGCGIGNNTVPWARTYPEAEVHAIDVGAPLLRYGHARAQAQGVTVHFHQRQVEEPGFEDESFDLIFSSMLLHEVPPKGIGSTFSEAYRLLKPGGLMLHMELPPNNMTGAYDSFYLDWDSYYNKEPFYKPFRDMDPRQVCAAAGFAAEDFVYFVIPSLHLSGAKAIRKAVSQKGAQVDKNTGRLAKTIQWFCFGAWK